MNIPFLFCRSFTPPLKIESWYVAYSNFIPTLKAHRL